MKVITLFDSAIVLLEENLFESELKGPFARENARQYLVEKIKDAMITKTERPKHTAGINKKKHDHSAQSSPRNKTTNYG